MRGDLGKIIVFAAIGALLSVSIAVQSIAQQQTPPAETAPGPPAKPAPAPPPGPAAAPERLTGTLPQRLDALVNGSLARNSTVSIKIVEVGTGRIAAQRNPSMAVIPASNMKLFTTAAAFELLPDDFKFVTTVSIRGEIDREGTLQGDLKVVGRGDPTIGGRFYDGDANTVFRGWARQLLAQGIRTISGDLIFEHGYFDSQWVHPTWNPAQMVHWYQAPVAALSLQEGTVRVRVTPTSAGQRARVDFNPVNNYVTLQNTAVTGPGAGAFITRTLGTNNIIVRGNAPRGTTEVFIAIQNPVQYYAGVVRTTLEQEGIRVLGSIQLVANDEGEEWRPVIVHSTPHEIVSFVINKKSQNQYAEQMLKTLGAELRGDGSFGGGGAVIGEWLANQLGIPPDQFAIADGSGMSRQNQASADAFITVLQHMWDSPYRNDFLASMPFSGEVDSRFGRRRLNQAPFARRVYAKTGYISGVVGLSGYVEGLSGQVYAFSFLFNRFPGPVGGVYQLHDAILREIVLHG
jgi:serine-type D-Ala-D-Ala carboxypeptidase/endopeptidase (penicillin-binding protein 4)